MPAARAGTLLHPGRHPGRGFRFPPRRKPYATPPVFVPTVPGVTPMGVATFVLSLEPGAKLTLAWDTAIYTSYSGVTEQRESLITPPRRRVEGSAFLVTSGDRDAKSALMRSASSGATFAIGMPMEELLLTADAAGTVVTVSSIGDWVLPGARAVLVGGDGSTLNVVVQSSSSSLATITLGVVDSAGVLTSAQTLGTQGRAGGRIMPVLPVLLEGAQAFSRYATRVDLWSIRAQAQAFGWAGVDAMGIGASVTTYTTGAPVAITDITDADLLIWDRPNSLETTSSEVMLSGAALIDFGALPAGAGARTAPQWQRSLKYRSASSVDWQWLKAFLHLCRGRQRAFLLSTNQDDLVYVSTISTGGIKVSSSAIAGAGDYTRWYASLAHRRLAITQSDGSIVYAAVTSSPTDNGDGTLSIALDNSPLGTVTKVSLLEQIRLADDAIDVAWDGDAFSVDEQVVTVTDVIVPPSLFMFDTVISPTTLHFAGVPFNDVSLSLGSTTQVNLSVDNAGGTIALTGLAAVGGNVEGMVVCLTIPSDVHIWDVRANHEDAGSAAQNRFVNSGLAFVSSNTFGFIMYRYSGALSRWVLILKQ
jgi:hypothetical protein